MMANLTYQFDWTMDYTDIWSNIISVSVWKGVSQ